MASYSGIYQHYEGNTTQCDAVQQYREIVFVQDSGALRFKDCSGNYFYLGAKGEKGDIGTIATTGTSGYLPVFSSSSGIVTSVIFQSGDNIQIGSNINNNLYKLYVNGSGKLTNLDVYNLISSGNVSLSGNLTVNSTGIFNIITVTNTGIVSNLNSDSLDGQHGYYYLNRANQSGTQSWTTISSKPTTLVGYGITDGISGVIDSPSIDFTLIGGKISGVVLPGGVDHNSLSNYDANKHIDHTSISIIAGSGLSGGGTLAASRTLTISEGNINHALLYNVNSSNYTHLTATNHTDLTDGGATTLHKHDHGGLDGLGDNDHPQYVSGVYDSSSIDFSLVGQNVSGAVLPAGVNHDLLLNYSGNKHVDHTLVSISTGSGLSGGGTIASTRTLTVSEGNVNHAALYNLNSANYTHLTSANHTDLTDGGDSSLHYHQADRNYTDTASGALNAYITNTSGILNSKIDLKSFSANIVGTSGYLSKFNTSSGIVNSIIYEASGSKIGINTLTPQATLDVNGSGNFRSNLLVSGNIGIGINPDYKLQVYDGDTSLSIDHYLRFNTIKYGYASPYINYYYSGPTALYIMNQEDTTLLMTITNSGNVGIGTSSQESYYTKKLVVDGGLTNGEGITIVATPSNVSYILFADGISGVDAYRGTIAYNHGTDTMSIGSNGGNALYISSANYIGISQDSPTYTLDVTGSGRFTQQLKIDTINSCPTDVDKFLVSSGGLIQYRTGAQVLSDIGAQSTTHGVSATYIPYANTTTSFANSPLTTDGTNITILGDGTYIKNGPYSRIYNVRGIASGNLASVYGAMTTYNAEYSGGYWKALSGGHATAFGGEEGMFVIQNSQGLSSNGETINWITKFKVHADTGATIYGDSQAQLLGSFTNADANFDFDVVSTNVAPIAQKIRFLRSATANSEFQIFRAGTTTVDFVKSSGGYVGIGTTDPGYSLDINGSTRVGNATADTHRFLYINGVVNKAVGVSFQESGFDRWLIGNGPASNNGNFEIYDATNGNNFILTRDGKMGIGFTPRSTVSIIGPFQYGARPAVSSHIIGELHGGENADVDAGFFRISTGGATTKTWIDLASYNTTTDCDRNIVFGTASTERMRITSAGVGIGTTTPEATLECHGPAWFGIDNYDTQVLTPVTVASFFANGKSEVYPVSSFDFQTVAGYRTSNKLQIHSWDSIDGQTDPLLTIVGNGNVGIGINNPATLLDVSGEISVRGQTYGIRFYDSKNSNWSFIKSVDNGASNCDLVLASAGGETLRLDANKNVGINSTTPFGKLYIQTAAETSCFSFSNLGASNYGTAFYMTNDSGTKIRATRIRSSYATIGTNTYANFGIDRSTDEGVIGSDPSLLTYTNSFCIDGSNGYVGIGTVAPVSLLHIKGSNPYISLESTTATGFLQYLNDSNTMRVYDGSDYTMTWQSGIVNVGTRITNIDTYGVESRFNVNLEDSGTNDSRYPLSVRRYSTGTPLAESFGAGILFEIDYNNICGNNSYFGGLVYKHGAFYMYDLGDFGVGEDTAPLFISQLDLQRNGGDTEINFYDQTSLKQQIVWNDLAEFFSIGSSNTPITVGHASNTTTMAGTIKLNTCINANGDYDKFLVLDTSGNVDFRTGANILSDIGAAASLSGTQYFIPMFDTTTTIGDSPLYSNLGKTLVSSDANMVFSGTTSRSVTGIGSSASFVFDLDVTSTNVTPTDQTIRILRSSTTNSEFQILRAGTTTVDFIKDKNGNVGIGATLPDSKLEVSSAENTQIKCTETQGGSGAETILLAGAAMGWVGTQTNHPFNICTNYTSKIYVSTDGNVGIGTTLPESKLHISGGVINVSDAETHLARLGSNSVGTLSNHAFYVVANNGIKLSIAANGNVGVMTGVPQYKLDVDGEVRIQTISSLATAATTFLTHEAGVVCSRTIDQTTSDVCNAQVVNYSASTTLTAFSGTPTSKFLMYYKLGTMVTVFFNFSGTSNTTDFSFTLPAECARSAVYSETGAALGTIVDITDNNGGHQVGWCEFISGTTVTIYKDAARNTFTSSNQKSAKGTITYGAVQV